jgi:hypothetical protein
MVRFGAPMDAEAGLAGAPPPKRAAKTGFAPARDRSRSNTLMFSICLRELLGVAARKCALCSRP